MPLSIKDKRLGESQKQEKKNINKVLKLLHQKNATK